MVTKRKRALKEYIGNPKGRNAPALNKNFSRRDANKDGKLSLVEIQIAVFLK